MAIVNPIPDEFNPKKPKADNGGFYVGMGGLDSEEEDADPSGDGEGSFGTAAELTPDEQANIKRIDCSTKVKGNADFGPDFGTSIPNFQLIYVE